MTELKPYTLQLYWRKIKRLLEWLIYGLFDTAILAHQKKAPDAAIVAIVQVKLLGDLILWLPYAKALVRHSESLQRNVTLIVNAAVQPLVEPLFPNCTVISLNRSAFINNFSERKILLRQLRQLGAGITYVDTHPRDAIIEDSVVRALGAPAWGFDATFPDRPWIDCHLSRRLYTQLLPSMNNMHQSLRHLAFLSALNVDESYLEPIHIPCTALSSIQVQSSPYFVIAPGASRAEKRWPTHSFIELAQRILNHHPEWQLIVLGTHSERMMADEIVRTVGERAKNYAGKTDLLDFINWIAHAELAIGNDSAACHIAAACGVASFPIVGGGHPGWFFPYPPNTVVQHTPDTIIEPMPCFGCDWICCYRRDKYEPFPCIARITPDHAWKKISAAPSKDKIRIIDDKPNANHSTSS